MTGLLSAMLLACAGALYAQGGADGESLAALRHGPLVVWFLAASTKPPQSNLDAVAALHNATPLNYREQTTGNFGQNASTYGQNASSYGVDADSPTISTPSIPADQDVTDAKPNGIGYQQKQASNFGQNAGGYGTASSNVGQEASTAGQNAGSYGTEASRYGTAASNVGQAASDFGAGNSNATNGAAAPSVSADVAAQQPLTSPLAEQVKETLRQVFPDLQMKFIGVDPDQLKARLMAARGTQDFPDVLLGTLPASWWSGMDTEYGVAMLRPAVFYPNGVTENSEGTPEVAILARAPHMQAARAFVLWMSEPTSGCPGCVQSALTGKEAAAAAVAKHAMESLLNGEPLDGADPALVMDSSKGVQRMLATMGNVGGNTEANTDGVRVQVEHASVNGGLAAVGLRVVVSATNVFGVAHPLVVLRTSKDGQWKVLQMSLNLPQHEQANERQALMVSSPPSSAEQSTGVKGIVQAAPLDGQNVAQVPQLVWDNHGGAGLQVVEWQRGEDGAWSDTRLYLVEDRNPTLRTQVMAEFADANGRYRWRVWSVGAHGDVLISTWRTFRLMQ